MIKVSTPTEQGIDPAGIAAFLDAIESDAAIEPHGLIIQRHGRRVAEGYWRPHHAGRSRLLYSLSKTFTGTALALQIGEGRVGLDDLVSEHLSDACTTAHAGLRELRVRHIASMASGHNRETLGEARALDAGDVVRGFLRIPPDAPPGTLFAYNQPPVIALATLLQKRASARLVDYLRPRLFEPLGMGDVRWAHLYPGIDCGFTGAYASLDAVARLGQLYLNDGVWNGQRILPAGWVAAASSVQTPNPANTELDWRQGYGLQLWRSRHGYRGDGAFGQYMVVLPEQDTMIALFSSTQNMQRVLDLMWTHLLPAIANAAQTPGPADVALAERLAMLSLPTAQQRSGARAVAPSSATAVSGATLLPTPNAPVAHRTITSITVHEDRLTLHEDGYTSTIALSADWQQIGDTPIATSATQLPNGDIAIDAVLLATPHRFEIVLHPTTLTFDTRWPVLPLFGAGIDKPIGSMRAPV